MASNYLSLAYQQLGRWDDARDAIDRSLSLFPGGVEHSCSMPKEDASEVDIPDISMSEAAVLASICNTRGRFLLSTGESETALSTWKTATQYYQHIGDRQGELGSRINQVQAMQVLGLYRLAEQTLTEIDRDLEEEPDPLLKAIAYRSLGNLDRRLGEWERSRERLQRSLDILQQLQQPEQQAATLLSLGDSWQPSDRDKALDYYQQAELIESASPTTKLKAGLKQLQILVENSERSPALSLLERLRSQLGGFQPSRVSVYGYVELAERSIQLGNKEVAAQLLSIANQQAEGLNDPRSHSYALGVLGRLYEENQQYLEAKIVTQKAIQEINAVKADDIAYLWNWQLGRVLTQLDDRNAAATAYELAIENLKEVRRDIATLQDDLRFNFRDKIRPVYREFVDLVLTDESIRQKPGYLKKAIDAIESLQLAEINNFFGDFCTESQEVGITEIDPTAAIIYPIVLRDRIAIVYQLPDSSFEYKETFVDKKTVTDVVTQLKSDLKTLGNNPEVRDRAKKLYNWIVRPLTNDLNNSKTPIETLVFVADEGLRNIPMSVFLDEEDDRYLIQKGYNIAMPPGIELLQKSEAEQQQVLAGGFDKAQDFDDGLRFRALEYVREELEGIKSRIADVVLLFGSEFTQENLLQFLSEGRFSVVHFSTHGLFGSDLDRTFIVAANKERIYAKDLVELIRSGTREEATIVELLVLSACETAEGDDRAVLGLAGIAVRSGARSTLASLWVANDSITKDLMLNFYQYWQQDGLPKAEALRKAQLELIERNFPEPTHHWANFIIVGHWR